MSIEVEVAGQHFRLYPQRAVLWIDSSCLLLSDLHLGKADTLRRHGIAVPQAVQAADLQRLDQVLRLSQPKRCVVLGDFLHGATYAVETLEAWRALVAAHPDTAFELVLGNHDRWMQGSAWQLQRVQTSLQIGKVLLSHEPEPRAALEATGALLNIHGHIHPAWRLAGWHEKLPALVYAQPRLILPAFSEFTAGVVQQLAQEPTWVFVSQENLVVRVN